jgi:hypothetical protein
MSGTDPATQRRPLAVHHIAFSPAGETLEQASREMTLR